MAYSQTPISGVEQRIQQRCGGEEGSGFICPWFPFFLQWALFGQYFILNQLNSTRWEYQTTLWYKKYYIEFLCLDNYSNNFKHDINSENTINIPGQKPDRKEQFLAISHLATFCRRPHDVALTMDSLCQEETQKKKRKWVHHLWSPWVPSVGRKYIDCLLYGIAWRVPMPILAQNYFRIRS